MDSEEQQEYVGLINQARTCYLNCLIQALYMTPEFRNAILCWNFDGPDSIRHKSVACQLQNLFVRLLTSKLKSLETTELTASFGWTQADAWEQHDVQEFWEAMFDALEKALRKTIHVGLLSHMYKGQLVDYVRCLQCHRESSHKEAFSSLQLAVCSPDRMNTYSDLNQALRAHLVPEVLSGDNVYHCDNCARHCEAEKGHRIIRFPYILCVQLKRFSFNYETQCRLKLNERLTYPDVLDLNDMISGSEMEEEDAGIEQSCCYELFVIMVHSGSANGGHYFSFIKNLDKKQWYRFDDCNVTSACAEQMEQAYGGTSSGWMSNTSAYMLMYRQVDRSKNKGFLDYCALPPEVKIVAEALQSEEKAAIRIRENNRSLYKLEIFWEPNDLTLERFSVELVLHECERVQTALTKAVQLLALPETDSTHHYRLITLKTSNGVFELTDSLDTQETLMTAVRHKELLLQLCSNRHQQLLSNELTLHLFILDFDSCTFSEERLFGVSKTITINQLSQTLALKYEVGQAEHMRLVVEQSAHKIVLLDVPDKELQQYSTQTHVKIYADLGAANVVAMNDRMVDFDQSLLSLVIDRYKYTKHGFTVILPPKDGFVSAGLTYPDDLEATICTAQAAQPPTPDHFIRFISVQSSDNHEKCLIIDADRRLLISDLRRQVCDWLCWDERHCSFAKVLNHKLQYDIHDLRQCLDQLATVQAIRMKIGRTLLPGECSVPVVRFEMNELEKDWAVLFNVVVTSNSPIHHVRFLIREQLLNRLAITVPSERILIRERLALRVPALKFNEESVMADRMCPISDPLLIQIIDPEVQLGEAGVSVFVRRWHAANLECGALCELHVHSLHTLRHTISHWAHIPHNRLLITHPMLKGRIRDNSYPFEVDTLALHNDKYFAFNEDGCSDLQALAGSVIYYRDASEVPRALTGAERCAVNSLLRRPSLAAASAARRERALRIYTLTASSMSFSD